MYQMLITYLATPVNPDPSAVMVERYFNCMDDKSSEIKQNFEGTRCLLTTADRNRKSVTNNKHNKHKKARNFIF